MPVFRGKIIEITEIFRWACAKEKSCKEQVILCHFKSSSKEKVVENESAFFGTGRVNLFTLRIV